MARAYLMSTLVMGVLLVLVAGFVSRTRNWHRRLPIDWAASSDTSSESGVSLTGLVASAVGVVLLVVGLSIKLFGSIGVLSLGIGLLVGTISCFFVWGMYHIARSRQLSRAQSIGIGAWFLGLLLLAGLVAQLLLSG